MSNPLKNKKVQTWLAVAGAVSVLAALPALAQEDVAEPQALVAGVCSFEGATGQVSTWECETENGTTPTTIPPTTTTTPPTTTEPPTTTTEPPTTTTTGPPPTTTTAPPTTTTTQPPGPVEPGPDPVEAVWPICAARSPEVSDTLCHYDVLLTVDVGQGPERMWEAPYNRSNANQERLWYDGTRDGYRWQWQFAECDGTPGFEARVAFTMGYGQGVQGFQVNDLGGMEGQYDWNGEPNVPRGRETQDAPQIMDPGGVYSGPSRPPTLRLYNVNTGKVCEVRDYKTATTFHHGPDTLSPFVAFLVDSHTTEPFIDDRAAETAPFQAEGETVIKAYMRTVESATVYYTSMDPAWEWHVTP